ncbi:hypothetical protein PN490_19290, partial [Nodularia spumigena CS-588/01]|nr:hypothetical protein [Nodularia spumigena CS-588/01]
VWGVWGVWTVGSVGGVDCGEVNGIYSLFFSSSKKSIFLASAKCKDLFSTFDKINCFAEI